jgi:hypothetical protein
MPDTGSTHFHEDGVKPLRDFPAIRVYPVCLAIDCVFGSGLLEDDDELLRRGYASDMQSHTPMVTVTRTVRSHE